ncbi:right-handed parallel beta-helix repeat-containing protein [uncultured Deinococcus sp.]|uniref:right-handed parallel beta-helix repeat-containing protein n=1 Tax=uncultured Deinococcus sp. TaxID=158789 RepID=UPI002583264B|nr:right-handed parallel beta-helix repeat-containing protein [uncultured Deinococcus sp.]
MILDVLYTAPLPAGFVSGTVTLKRDEVYIDGAGNKAVPFQQARINADRTLTDVTTGQPLQTIGQGLGDPLGGPLTWVESLRITGVPDVVNSTHTMPAIYTAPGQLDLHRPNDNAPTIGTPNNAAGVAQQAAKEAQETAAAAALVQGLTFWDGGDHTTLPAKAGLYRLTSGGEAGQIWERRGDGSLVRNAALEAANSAEVNRAALLATLATKYTSTSTASPPTPTQAERDAYAAAHPERPWMPGSRRTASGGVQALRDSAAGWAAEGSPSASGPQVDAVRSAISNTLAGLTGKTPGDGAQFADGSRWSWRTTSPLPNGGTDPATVIKTSLGFLVREFAGPLQAVWYGVVADGVTPNDDAIARANTGRIAWGLPLQFPVGIVAVINEVRLSGGGTLLGALSASGGFKWTSVPETAPRVTRIMRLGRGAAGESALRLQDGIWHASYIAGMAGPVQPDGYGIIKYDHAVMPNELIPGTQTRMPDAPNNNDYAIVVDGSAAGSFLYRCEATQALQRGILIGKPTTQGGDIGATTVIAECAAMSNRVGIEVLSTDSRVQGGYYHHNVEHGGISPGAYPEVIGARIEWNARNGWQLASGNSKFVNNTVDRNGWAGLRVMAGQWVSSIVGNHFGRNGTGGNGTVGRFNYGPGHPSYIHTPEEECCHIRMEYMRSAAISGNTYKSGRSDANDGADGPAYIYYGDNVSECVASGNAGEVAASGGYGGYITDHPLYPGGAVEKLVNFSQRSLLTVRGVLDTITRVATTATAQITTLDIPLAATWHGVIHLLGGAYTEGGDGPALSATVRVTRTAGSWYQAFVDTHVNPKAANQVSVAASLTPSGPGVTLTITPAVFVRYRLEEWI